MLILSRTKGMCEGTILSTDETTGDPRPGLDASRNRFAFRVFQFCLLLLVLSLGILGFGRWYGASLSDAGHTTSDRLREIVIRNNVLTVPENAIRFKSARMDGVTLRLDLYLSWPELEGYASERRDAFNHVGGSREIIFLTFEEQVMSRDMSSRLEPVYRQIIEARSVAGPSNVRFHRFKKESGFAGEVLAIAETDNAEQPFVARCLTGTAAKEALAPCERDINIGNRLSLTYRFPAALLSEWQVLDRAIRQKASRLLNTPE